MSSNVFQMLQLSGQSLSLQRTRLNVVSTNLANAKTTRTPEGGPFQRRDVVLEATAAKDAFGNVLRSELGDPVRTVKMAEIRKDTSPPRQVYDPSHPDADGNGYVAMPNINTVEEMVNMITIMRSYQANLSTFQAIREMAQRALQIGRG